MRIIFCGTPEYAVPSLRRLAALPGHEVLLVVSQPDRPKGRSDEPAPPPVAEAARALHLPVLQPASFNSPDVLERLRGLQPDLFCVIAYGQLLKKAALAIPRLFPLNAHGSLLPKFRGAAPIQGALLAGDAETGVTIMRMERGLDKGPVLLARSIPVLPIETAGSLHDKLADLSAECFAEAIERVAGGGCAFTPQDDALATYSPKLEKTSGRMEWSREAAYLERLVRAMNPWPGAWTTAAAASGAPRQRLRVVTAVLSAPPPGLPSAAGSGLAVRDDHHAAFVVACGQGALRIQEVQPEGKRVMTAAEYLNGAGRVFAAATRWE